MMSRQNNGLSPPMDAGPSTASLTFRAKLAAEISGLRRTRSKVPFFRLAAHRVPTLNLFRALLRAAPDATIKFRVGALFRKYRGLTSPTQTVTKLECGYKYLEFFQKAAQGDPHHQGVLARYSRLIEARRHKIYINSLLDMQMAEINRLRTRPILTGGFHSPNIYHGPLPWMVPQPPNVSGMILSRRKSRAKRLERQDAISAALQDLKIERDLEEKSIQETRKMGHNAPTMVYGDEAFSEWTTPMKQMLADISKSYERDAQRAVTPYSPELVATIFEARREKIRNKTNQRQREARGEYFPLTRRRMRSRPPSHVWQTMTPEQRDIQHVLRKPTKVGWVGKIRRQNGLKLSEEEERLADILENGHPKNRTTLNKVIQVIRRESERRRNAEQAKLD